MKDNNRGLRIRNASVALGRRRPGLQEKDEAVDDEDRTESRLVAALFSTNNTYVGYLYL
jgi:hypothetical protein